MTLHKGDIVEHRISDQDMIVTDESEGNDNCKCRYYNKVTGRYEDQWFLKCEIRLR